MLQPEDKKEIAKMISTELSNSFSRRIGDTPTDNLQLVNRKYVNLYGTTSQRPTSSIATAYQKFFDTTINRPIYFNPNTSVWSDGAGSVS